MADNHRYLRNAILAMAGSLPLLANAQSPTSLESQALNPWISPLQYCNEQRGNYRVDIDMGFLNTDYLCTIDQQRGVQFDTRDVQTARNDAARLVLGMANQCNQLESIRIQAGASRNSAQELRALVPNAPMNAVVLVEKNRRDHTPDENHAKVFQLSNGVDRFVTVHGSVNLQTVGMTCKANNALRFVETTPALYAYFNQLADAVQADSGTSRFSGARGSRNSSGTSLEPVAIGNYVVRFYAGRSEEFVGGESSAKGTPWPAYINPPIPGQHRAGVVNWYDSALYDAARQLRLGRSVTLDVLVFEVGQESSFVNNLWRFVQEGFSSGVSEDKQSAEPVASPFPGKLQVRFLYQFQNTQSRSGFTYSNLNDKSRLPSGSGSGGTPYSLVVGKIWEVLGPDGRPVNPTTPYDMHNKLMLMDVAGHEDERRLYVTSSNLDKPGQHSGRLWQAGTIVSARPGSAIWSGAQVQAPNLWNAYKQYFEMLWANRTGQPDSGQVAFHRQIAQAHDRGAVNWIETGPAAWSVGDRSFKGGIDAYFFPIPFVPDR